MNEKQIKSLEKKFAVELPAGYRQMLLSPPYFFKSLLNADAKDNHVSQTPFLWDKGLIEGYNQMMRDPDDPDYFGFDPNDPEKLWPDRYFIIGSDIGGNFYCIAPKTGTSRVYFWYQGDTAFSKISDDMSGFVKRMFRMYGELAAMDCE